MCGVGHFSNSSDATACTMCHPGWLLLISRAKISCLVRDLTELNGSFSYQVKLIEVTFDMFRFLQ